MLIKFHSTFNDLLLSLKKLSQMDSKKIVFITLLLGTTILLIRTEATAREVTETSTSKSTSESILEFELNFLYTFNDGLHEHYSTVIFCLAKPGRARNLAHAI